MQYIKKFNEGFFDFLKPKVKKDSFTKKEADIIYNKISKMITSPFSVREYEVPYRDPLYMFNIEIVSNIPITIKKLAGVRMDRFYFNDIKIPTIYISLTKSTIGKKSEYYISNVSNFLAHHFQTLVYQFRDICKLNSYQNI